jgi:hypothetical protein
MEVSEGNFSHKIHTEKKENSCQISKFFLA